MRAVQITNYGPVKDIKITTSALNPHLVSGYVLVHVKAVGLNPIDWKMATGELRRFMQLPFPFTLASDFAGVIAEISENVTHLKPGDEVYGMAGFNRGGSGALAEIALANADFVWKKPKELSFAEAAAVPMTGLRAWTVLHDVLQLQKGQKFFIPGGAGGIGSFAIQIAKHMGAYVATAVSSKDIEFVKSLGADEIIDYTKDDFATKLSAFDAAFDVVGDETFAKCFAILRPGARITTMLWGRRPDLMQKYGVHFIEQGESATPNAFIELGKLLDTGAIKVHIDKVSPLEQAGEALDYLEFGHPQGKVVVKVVS